MPSSDKTRVRGRFVSKNKIASLLNLKNNKVSDSLNKTDTPVLDGRRIVEFSVLFAGLNSCPSCKKRLNILDFINETKQGLGSILKVRCEHCNAVSNVPTGKRHSSTGDSTTARCFDINTKLAAAMLNAGIGEMQMNNILSELNLPTIHHSTLKRREREVGVAFEDVAKLSCDKAIKEEIALCEKDLNEQTPMTVPSVSSDGGWQRRGHNSLSGHVTMVGRSTKKCLSYSVAKKSCRICKSAKRKGINSTKHPCRRNWSGSAKGMEPHLTVTCLKKLLDNGLNVKQIIMDDDTATYTRVKRSLLPDLIKCSDKNHVIKNAGTQLHRLKDNHKTLSVTVINYLKRLLSYAITQNFNNEEGVKRNISAIVPHAYGEHDLCNPLWCRWYATGDEYKHSSLPQGDDLTDKKLRQDLQELFTSYTTDAMAKKLANVGSSNSNENLNQLISRKAPKSQHYSGSESLDFRVSAAVAQKNDGHKYIMKVNETCGLFTEKRASKLDAQRSQGAKRQCSIENKRRRLKLKEERLSFESVSQIHEGITYQSNIEAADPVNDLQAIPAPPVAEKLNCATIDIDKEKLIVFDLETTGLGHASYIIQIAAQHVTSGDMFSKYVHPTHGCIPAAVSRLTGIEMHGNVLFHHDLPVSALSAHRALDMFRQWLMKFDKPVLVAHNAHFDSKVLVHSFQRQNMTFPDICGFADSLKLFRAVYPDLGNHKQEFLVQELLSKNYVAHDAVSDVSTLVDLINTVSDVEQKLHIFSTSEVTVKLQKLNHEKNNISSFTKLISEGILSKSGAKTLARSGLDESHMCETYSRHGVDGLMNLLRPRYKNFRKLSMSLQSFYANESKM